jgi:hypothetical protein
LYLKRLRAFVAVHLGLSFLADKDKWRLIDEHWCDLARQVESEAPNANIVELLEKRFSDYLVDPSQGRSVDDVFARLAEPKRQWK